MTDRGDRCEWNARCRNTPTVHYNCNGIDKWVCDVHLDDLHEVVEEYFRSDEYQKDGRPVHEIEPSAWRKKTSRTASVVPPEVRKVTDDLVNRILADSNK